MKKISRKKQAFSIFAEPPHGGGEDHSLPKKADIFVRQNDYYDESLEERLKKKNIKIKIL